MRSIKNYEKFVYKLNDEDYNRVKELYEEYNMNVWSLMGSENLFGYLVEELNNLVIFINKELLDELDLEEGLVEYFIDINS